MKARTPTCGRPATWQRHGGNDNAPSIGDLIAKAMEKIGNNGVIIIEESKSTETVLAVVEGMQFDRGFQSPYVIPNQDKKESELKGCR